MPVTHNPGNINEITDWTDAIEVIDNQFGFIRSTTSFVTRTTGSTSILFDRISNDIRLIPSSNPRAKERHVGKDRNVEQYAMALQWYADEDYIDVQDIQDQRMPGKGDTAESFENVRMIKLEDLKMAHDQTDEHLRYNAMIGNLPAGAATGSANMYDLFGLTIGDFTVDLETETSTTDLDAKFAEVKRKVADGNKTGSAIGGVDFWLDPALFDEIVAHPKFREVYLNYSNSPKQMLTEDKMNYFKWGVTSFFEHDGIRFLSYNPTFLLADGTSDQVLGAGEGVALPRGSNMLRGYYGPANKLSLANRGGQELFAFERTGDDDEQHIIQTQSRKLYFAGKPEAIIQLT